MQVGNVGFIPDAIASNGQKQKPRILSPTGLGVDGRFMRVRSGLADKLARCEQRQRLPQANMTTTTQKQSNGAMVAPSVHVWADLGDTLPDFTLDNGQGQGRGACLVSAECLDFLPVSVGLASQYAATGPLLAECQGQLDLASVTRQAKRLVGGMRRNGSEPSNATEHDAIGDGLLALVQWRNTYGPRVLGETAALVSWRAVVRSVSVCDLLGESITLWQAPDSEDSGAWDSLTGSALPLPQLCGDATRADKAARLLFERARAKRFGLLERRMASLKLRAAGRGKRAQVIDKLHAAAVQLLHGDSLDHAAQAAGFKASGTGYHAARTGDRLGQAARRVGLKFQATARDREAKQGQGHGPFVPLSAVTIAAMEFKPSATLRDRCNGRGSKQRVPLLRRLQRRADRAARQQAKRQAWAVKLAKRQAKRQAVTRAQARNVAKLGLWAGALPVPPLPRRYGLGKLSESRNRTWLKYGQGPMD